MNAINITAAAKLSGKSEATLRRWAAQKIVPAKKSENGKWLFDRDTLTQYLSAHSEELINAGIIKQQSPIAHDQPLITAYERQIKLLDSSLERERRTNDCLKTQLDNAQSENRKLNQEIKILLSKDTNTSPARWIRTKVQEAFGHKSTH